MKTAKLTIGISTLSLTLFLFFLLPPATSKTNTIISLLTSTFFALAGLISLCTHKSDGVLSDLLCAISYFLCCLITVMSAIFDVIFLNSIIFAFMLTTFALTVVFLSFAVYKHYYANKSIVIVKTTDSGITCPMCNTYHHSDVCPTCKTKATAGEIVKTCFYCNRRTVNNICPNCGALISDSICETLSSKGFVISKMFNGLYCSLFIDDINKKWCIYNKCECLNKGIYLYSNILKVELYKDGETVSSGNFNSALIGGLLFGAAGAIIGASGEQTNQNVCKAMSVLVYVDNLYTPVLSIDIVKQPVFTVSEQYQKDLSFAREIISTFDYMINKSKIKKK